jgi:hypothetical protein
MDPTAVAQLSGDAQLAVGACGVFVHLGDLAGEPGMSERPLRWWADLPVVVARDGHAEHQASVLHVESLPGQGGDHREEAFGGRFCSRNTSLTFRETASSVSSWRIRPSRQRTLASSTTCLRVSTGYLLGTASSSLKRRRIPETQLRQTQARSIGWENGPALAEDCRDPRRSIPRALCISIAIATGLFVLFAYATVTGFHYRVASIGRSSVPFLTVADDYLGMPPRWCGPQE